jgi:aspartyl-tRNA(Asn)/glutamyl-tRNA(Gln) amidotransferase subunit B
VFQSYIGLEIHIQLSTKSKVFCGCKAAFGGEPNSNVCPVCLGYPGVLPALNEEAMRLSYLVARALNCGLSERAVFERKNYFYPDMPKNYQISQFASPLAKEGFLDIAYRRHKRRVRIREVHLEEDAGKMIHAGDLSLLDYNRAGTPLLEIVTEPDLEVGEEAELFLQHFRRLVRYLGVCDGNMEEGSLRCDANVSVSPRGRGLGSKVEIKNLNSFKFVRKALNYEIERQEKILEQGGAVTQETRLWNENRDLTEGMRSKESALDYRYFPEPDLPPFRPDAAWLESVDALMVELPQARCQRFLAAYPLSESQADFLCAEKEGADFFEDCVAAGADPRAAALWLAADVRKLLNRRSLSLAQSPLTAAWLAELLGLLAEGKIHGRIAKQVLEAVFEEKRPPGELVRAHHWEQISDRGELAPLVAAVMEKESAAVAQIRSGDAKPLGFLIGRIMRESGGRAEPGLVRRLLNEALALTFIQVLSMGGAIGGSRTEGGAIVPGDLTPLVRKLNKQAGKRLPANIRFQELEISRILSEEITPEDWAALISAVDGHLRDEDVSGIVIAHGTDTLAYTASLLFWLFPEPSLPLVLTASLDPEDSEADLKRALAAATEGEPGIYISLEEKIYSPLNIKFTRVGRGGFVNWNQAAPVFAGANLTPLYAGLPGQQELTRRLKRALSQVCLLKIYPGMKADYLIALMNAGIRYFVLELYDTGTANLRETPYSLKNAFLAGKERGVHFFCTSQQEGIVDFSGYITSHELWREKAVPMGSLTTESAFTRLLAILLFSQDEEEVLKLMEEANADLDSRS